MKSIVFILMMVVLYSCTEHKRSVWYKGNTHAHSTYSDGDSDAKDVIKWYHDNNYHFLFVTDHNCPLDPDSIKFEFSRRPDFILIPGNEVTDDQHVHTTALNTTKRLPTTGHYRKKLKNGEISDAEFHILSDTKTGILSMHVKNILEAGGIPVLNHPNYRSGVQVVDILSVQELKHLELFNGSPEAYNWGNDIHSAVEITWDSLLIHGKLIYGVASDDVHHLKENGSGFLNPGRGWMMVHAVSLSAENIMNAIKSGDFYSSTGVFLEDYSVENNVIKVSINEKATLDELNAGRGYPRTDLKDVTPGFTIEFIGYNGKILQSENAVKAKYKIQPSDQYVRVKISYSVVHHGKNDTYYAWTQPLEAKKGFFKFK